MICSPPTPTFHPQLSEIRSSGLAQRQTALEGKTKEISAVQQTIEAEKSKQKQLEKELDAIRNLEPKVSDSCEPRTVT